MAEYQNQENLSFLESKKKALLQSLKKDGIKNEYLLKAMKKVPREEFVPSSMKRFSYDDLPLDIGYNQTISAPSIVAYMIEKSEIKSTHHVLEIGTGSGYQTAILSLLSKKVESIEIVPELAKKAEETLKKIGFLKSKKISLIHGSGFSTMFQNESFDVIIVSAAPEHIPKHLKDLLKINGRLIVPTGRQQDIQKLLKIT